MPQRRGVAGFLTQGVRTLAHWGKARRYNGKNNSPRKDSGRRACSPFGPVHVMGSFDGRGKSLHSVGCGPFEDACFKQQTTSRWGLTMPAAV